MTQRSLNRQIEDHSRGRGTPLQGGGCCDLRPADWQGGYLFCPVAKHQMRSSLRCLVSRNTGRDFGPGLFSFARRSALDGLSMRGCSSKGSRWRLAIPSRLVGRLQFVCCALIGRSHQLYRISDKPGSDLAYPFHVSTSSPSREHEPRTRQNGTLLYQQGNFPNRNGAPQHECG
jgi:hypothetical protein